MESEIISALPCNLRAPSRRCCLCSPSQPQSPLSCSTQARKIHRCGTGAGHHIPRTEGNEPPQHSPCQVPPSPSGALFALQCLGVEQSTLGKGAQPGPCTNWDKMRFLLQKQLLSKGEF